MKGFAPEDLIAVFSSLQAAGWDAVLIGGQAVNLWARHYEEDLPGWLELRPYTSRDLDYHGGLADARLAMKVLRARGRLNSASEPSPNAGVLTVRLSDGRELVVDILTGVFGVSATEVERTAVELSGTRSLSGLTLRVIHPLLLLEAKAAALRGLSQAGRQDEKHLKILVLVLGKWLREQLNRPRPALRAVERLAGCAASPDGLNAFARGVDMLQIIPWDEMRALDDFARFFERRAAQLLERIEKKREAHLDALEEQDRP